MINSRENDKLYLSLRERCLFACSLLPIKAKAQAEDKEWLKTIENQRLKRTIRHRIAERRRGKDGLRALNKAIMRFYNYCDMMGY